ncbi:YoaK family protein [uncultured Gemmiger sp.]|uniref:YoaK family protein n=1 Tax=uncultured Gemmiger sp. TaxID=1623490 RepID=UPI0025F63B9D|nr:YoaK family protein [uncultured Gemmiger sp.]
MLEKLRHHGQMSDALRTMVFLTLSGGFQDGYTYMGRGQVFANAQTGNVILFGVHLCSGEWAAALRYLTPVVAFGAGVYFSAWVRHRFGEGRRLHWRQLVLGIEILLLFAVGFLPNTLDIAANVLVSFVCAMQVQAFRKVRGNAYASTMCIGNLRSGVQCLFDWRHNGDAAALRKALQYLTIITVFAVGAVFGSLLSQTVGVRVIWCSCALLAVSFFLMFSREEEA